MPSSPNRVSRRGARYVAMVLALILALGTLAACGSDDNDGGSTSGGGGTSTAKKSGKDPGSIKLGIVTASTTQNPFQEMTDGSKAAAQEAGTGWSSQAPPQIDPPASVQLFQGLTRTAKDGVAYETVAPDVFTRPTKLAADKGIPLVAVDTVPLDGSGVDTYVGDDNIQLGKNVATELLKKIPADAKGEIVLGNNIPGLPLLVNRLKGMKEVINKERPGIKVLGPFNVGAEAADNYAKWSAQVKAHPNALAYMEPGAQGAVSFKKISDQNGKKYLMAGCDVDPTALQSLKAGAVTVLGDPHHWMKGYIATRLLADHAINGTDLPKGWWDSGTGIVTSENVDEIIAREKDTASRAAWFKDIIAKQVAEKPVRPMTEAN